MASTDRFGYEWDKYDFILPHYEEQFLKWVYPLQKEDFKGKKVLDAGCGMGRNSLWPLKYGAEKVVAFDADERSVKAARRNLSDFENAKVDFGDIYTYNPNEEFDIVFSIGVIHHLKDPKKALQNLAKYVKPGGKLLIWVYGYEGNEWIVKYINPLRKYIFSKLPVNFVHILAYIFSIPLYLYVKIFPQKRPYLKQLKGFTFKHIHSIVFDQLIPEIANYWTKEQALSLFEELEGIKNVKIYPVNNLSWTVTGEKIESN